MNQAIAILVGVFIASLPMEIAGRIFFNVIGPPKTILRAFYLMELFKYWLIVGLLAGVFYFSCLDALEVLIGFIVGQSLFLLFFVKKQTYINCR